MRLNNPSLICSLILLSSLSLPLIPKAQTITPSISPTMAISTLTPTMTITSTPTFYISNFLVSAVASQKTPGIYDSTQPVTFMLTFGADYTNYGPVITIHQDIPPGVVWTGQKIGSKQFENATFTANSTDGKVSSLDWTLTNPIYADGDWTALDWYGVFDCSVSYFETKALLVDTTYQIYSIGATVTVDCGTSPSTQTPTPTPTQTATPTATIPDAYLLANQSSNTADQGSTIVYELAFNIPVSFGYPALNPFCFIYDTLPAGVTFLNQISDGPNFNGVSFSIYPNGDDQLLVWAFGQPVSTGPTTITWVGSAGCSPDGIITNSALMKSSFIQVPSNTTTLSVRCYTPTPAVTPTSGTFTWAVPVTQVATSLGCSSTAVQAVRAYELDAFTSYLVMRMTALCGCTAADILALRKNMAWNDIAAWYGLDWQSLVNDVLTRVSTLPQEVTPPSYWVRAAANDYQTIPADVPSKPIPKASLIFLPPTTVEVCP